jgi:hypothetical protein
MLSNKNLLLIVTPQMLLNLMHMKPGTAGRGISKAHLFLSDIKTNAAHLV